MPSARLECAAIGLDFVDGRSAADRNLVIRTDAVVLAGGGTIDLASESIALRVQPHVRDTLGLPVARSPRSITLSGPLSSPRVAAGSDGLLQESLSAGTSWATRSLQNAAGRVFDAGDDDAPECGAVLRD